MPSATESVRLTALLASLSLATDLGTGQPLGHGLRTCLLAVNLARELGLDSDEVRAVHHVSLLRFLGCTADSFETARMAGGDDLAFNATMAPVLNASRGDAVRKLVGAIAPKESPLQRTRMVVAALADTGEPARGLAAHCEAATMLAQRLGMDEHVITALDAAYERWDGKGFPRGLKGEAVPVAILIATVARDVDLFSRRRADVGSMLERRSGKAYDPAVVEAFAGLAGSVPEADWDAVLSAEPAPVAYVDDLEPALGVMADFVDLKSPWFRGHSSRVAELSEGAAHNAGLGDDAAAGLRRAGLVHDLGRVGVANGIWDKPGPLSTDECEQVRLHPYLTERILDRYPELAHVARLASSHQERLDGSGYHRQASASELATEARLLAAADVMVALMSPRPHREALDLNAATAVMRRDVEDGRLDGKAVEWVVAAAGGHVESRRSPYPAGLTEREVEVLRLLSRGLTNRHISDQLFISVKTVGRHVENIYAKIGVSARAGAALYAMEHRLLD